MDIAIFRERMKKLLLQLPDARLASGNKEIVLRCRYCGDSQRDRSSRHMYIQLPTGTGPMYFNCYRINCDAKGIVTWDKLVEWGVQLDDDDIRDIIEYNKEILKMTSNVRFKDRDVYILNNRSYNNKFEEMYNMKIKYINDRLGTNFTHIDLKRLKISLNILELIYENHLQMNVQKWKLKHIAEKYICFITQDNAYCVCRNTMYDPDNDGYMNYRYFKYKLYDILDDTRSSFYIIPSNVNILYPIKIYLTEGTFDILSVRFNCDVDTSNSIFCAVLGGGYEKAIKYFISEMKFINIEFHLYIDNDMQDYVLHRIIYILEPYKYNVYVHRNTYDGEKDFGVPKERIIDSVQHILKGW